MTDFIKPECKIICNEGKDVYYLIKTVVKSLKEAGFKDRAKDFASKVDSMEYDDILKLCLENVEFCFVYR